jgi:hypothetical protein
MRQEGQFTEVGLWSVSRSRLPSGIKGVGRACVGPSPRWAIWVRRVSAEGRGLQ